MESLARPPHRRKNSTITNGTSFKNPYDDVFLSNGRKTNSFEAHEYAEIFSGSSSIPVLDLLGLDERVGSGNGRSSKPDYSNIFGGLRNDDVAVPYEELFNGLAKKSKTRPYRTRADARWPLQESGSLHSSGKTRSSSEASDQSIDGVKPQFNLSFNRSSQRNTDVSNGKTPVAQLNAVSGFTYFVDGNLLQETEDHRRVPSLKREVSRTWSFSADIEAVKGKGGLSCNKLHVPDKSHNVTNDNLESSFLKVPPPSSRSSDQINKTPSRSSASNFASKEDLSKKIAGEPSPLSSDEEFDENSVAGLSAAALKKAIDQAQESIRIAKMIMERKKEGYQDSSKPRSRGRTKVLGKETKVDHEAYVSKENNIGEKYEAKDPIFTGIDGKVTPRLGQNDKIIAAGNTEGERVHKAVEAAKEHGQAFAKGGMLFASNYSQSETLCVDEKVELNKLGENVEPAETHGESTSFPGLVANAECKTANLKSEKVGYSNGLMLSMSKLAYHLGGLITGKERREITVHPTKEPEVGAELLERAPNTSERMQKLEKSVEEADRCQGTFDHLEGPGSRVETVLSTCQRTRELENIVDEPPENLTIIQDNEVTQRRESDADDKGKREKKFEEHEEMLDAEDLTVLRSELDCSLNESCNLDGDEGKEEMKKISENVPRWKDNGLGNTYAEENVSPRFENKEKLKKVLEEDNNGREPHIFPEKGEVEKEANEVYELENDKKKQNQNHARNEDEPELAGELEQNKIRERHMNTSEHDEVLNSAAFWDAEGTNNTLRGAEISEENNNKCEFQGAADEEETDVTFDVNNSDDSTIVNGDCTKDTGTIFSKVQEACNVYLNSNAEEFQKAFENYKENDTEHEVTVMFSAADEDKEAEHLFHLQDNEMPGLGGLPWSATEEIFLESKHNGTIEGTFADGKTENVGIIDADHEEKLPEDDAFKPTNEIPDAAQTCDAKINGQNLPEVRPSDRTAEIDLKCVRQVLEQTSELDEGSVSTSSFDNIDELSAHESEECAKNTKDKNLNKEDLNNELEMVSDGRKSSEEQSEGAYSRLHSETKEMEESMETETPVERDVNLEKHNEDLVGTSPMDEKDAKAGLQNPSRNDHQQRIEAIKREREREKDRIAVERAIREARERAFAEARERAERAAVERAAAEVRQRVIAEAREKLGKASGGKQPADKASTEAKLRAERAAVERATAEARERALEKAMSQKTYSEARTQADRYPSENFYSSSRNNGLKHSFSSSDLENGMDTESAQRRKARLERHQRIMERAAKALEEKNMRDLLAQKEQAERNRLAESLDADIKRWASGKEGNLRALLSTLQYILGPDSGWQPISLTEIITTAAVKKAYRKANLYVHPDKLQQRGASIQQKYICEKVFDLLKAAWNRFNSEER